MLSASEDLYYMFILAIPVANISWTITHEEIFREARESLMSRLCSVFFGEIRLRNTNRRERHTISAPRCVMT